MSPVGGLASMISHFFLRLFPLGKRHHQRRLGKDQTLEGARRLKGPSSCLSIQSRRRSISSVLATGGRGGPVRLACTDDIGGWRVHGSSTTDDRGSRRCHLTYVWAWPGCRRNPWQTATDRLQTKPLAVGQSLDDWPDHLVLGGTIMDREASERPSRWRGILLPNFPVFAITQGTGCGSRPASCRPWSSPPRRISQGFSRRRVTALSILPSARPVIWLRCISPPRFPLLRMEPFPRWSVVQRTWTQGQLDCLGELPTRYILATCLATFSSLRW